MVAHTFTALADYGSILLTAQADGALADLELAGADLEKLLHTDGTSVWVGIREQCANTEVTVTLHVMPPAVAPAWHVAEAGLVLAGDLQVRDGYVDADVRGTVPVAPGRWTMRVSLPDEPDPLGMSDETTLVRIHIDLWRPVLGDPDLAEVRVVRSAAAQPSVEEDTGAGTRQRRGSSALASRVAMRTVEPPRAVRRAGFDSYYLDEDGALWGFWEDKGDPVLTELEPRLASRLLAGPVERA